MTAASGVLGLVLYVLLQGEMQGFLRFLVCAAACRRLFRLPPLDPHQAALRARRHPGRVRAAFSSCPSTFSSRGSRPKVTLSSTLPWVWPRSGCHRITDGFCACARSRPCVPIRPRARACAAASFSPVPSGRDLSLFRSPISNRSSSVPGPVVDRFLREVVAVTDSNL